jgi:glucan 1,3-beta-glucosidase
MRFAPLLSCLSVIAYANAQLLHLPQVEKLVKEALKPLAAYTNYHGPKAGASNSIVQSVVEAAEAAVVDPSYWLADISHQGLAAFNSNPPGYKVFRNVKDYGAVGKFVPIKTMSMRRV